MKLWTDKRRARFLATGLLAAALAGGAAAAPPLPELAPPGSGPVEIQKVRFPDYNPDGSIKSEMFGDKALVEGNIIMISNLRVEMYEQGRLVTSFWAETCRYDKAAGTMESDSPVRVIRSGLIITGDGMDLKKSESVVVLRRNVRVLTIGGAGWFKVEKKK